MTRALIRQGHLSVIHDGITGGSPGPDPLRRLPPLPLPPPPSLEIGWKVPDHGRQREIMLELAEGEKMGFHPMCLYSKYSVF